MIPTWFVAALATLLGLLVGSFLNVVIHRVPIGQSVVSPPSHCPRCDSRIKGRHNVPVLGWLALRGRCASCALPISARYPLVEAATGLLFGAVVLRFGAHAELPALLYLAAICVALAMIDVDVRRLPDALVLPSYVVSLALLLPAGAVRGDWHAAFRAVGGGVALAALVLVLALTLPHVVGLDHAKLAGLLGLYLGWLSWGALALGLVVGLLVAVLAAGAVRARTASEPAAVPAPTTVTTATTTTTATATTTTTTARPATVPLAPCLIAGAALTLFVATPLLASLPV